MIHLTEATASPLEVKDRKVLAGPFAFLDEWNQNGRYYPASIYEPALKQLLPKIESRSLLGECDHPQDYDEVRLSNVSHVITECSVRENSEGKKVVYGKVELLDTPAGKILQALVEAGVTIGISSRGIGDTKRVREGEEVTQLKLITYDLVADPSFSKSILSVLSEQSKSALSESLNRIEEKLPLNESVGGSAPRKMIQRIRESLIPIETIKGDKVKSIEREEIQALRNISESTTHLLKRKTDLLKESKKVISQYEGKLSGLKESLKSARASNRAIQENMHKLQDAFNQLVENTVQKDSYERLEEQVVQLRKELAIERRGLSYKRYAPLLEGATTEEEINRILDTTCNTGRKSRSLDEATIQSITNIPVESKATDRVRRLSSIISNI